MKPPADQDADLLRFISAALELRDEGIEPPLVEICEGRSELIPAVAHAIGLADRLPLLQRDSVVHDSLVGQIFEGRYRLDARLGAGAMGVVYKGVDLELQRTVAVKLLHTAVIDADEAERRFVREAEALASIQHPAVVTVFDRGRAVGGQAYLIMELLEGLSLDELLEAAKRRGGPGQLVDSAWIAGALGLPALSEGSYLRSVVLWCAELAGGLGAAHEAGVFHRDVKPSNIFVRRDGRPALIDFGIAARDAHPTLMEREGMLGTPAYMAPECLHEKVQAAPALDVYGLAATLYHLLTLRPPYSGTPSQVISALARRDPIPARRLHSGLPRDLQAILDRGLARDPAARYESAADLEADLRAYLDFRPVAARPISSLARAWRSARRSPAVRAAALVSVLALALYAFGAWRRTHFAARAREWSRVWGSLPPAFTIWNARERRFAGEELAELRGTLERAVALADTSVPSRLYRAAFRLDQGDARGATDDMAVLAREHDSPYVRALAASYRALPPGAGAAAELVLDESLEPRSALESYLAAYHLLRHVRGREDLELARAYLSADELRAYAPAQEILLPLLLGEAGKGATREERVELYRPVHERSLRLEERLGRRTATSAHLIGGSLVGMQRYREALAPLREGVALAPRYHGLRNNLGVAAHRVGENEEAREQCEAAIALRPAAKMPYETLLRVHVARLDFAAARQVVDAYPLGESRADLAWRAARLAEIESERAIALVEQDPAEARRAARLALAQCERAGAEPEHPIRLVSQAILAGEEGEEGAQGALFLALARTLEADASNGRRLRALIRSLPETLEGEQMSALEGCLNALARILTPDPDPDPLPEPSLDLSPR